MRADSATTIEIAPGRTVPSWLLLSIVLIGQFMVVLDASIVNVALPSIQRDLHFSNSGLQWIVNAYTLTFAGFLLLGGRAADLYGRRKVFLVGLTVFTASSLLGGLAQNETWLISARALQGLGAAILAPATLTILTATFAEGPARAWAIGAWSAVSSAGASAGALLGGILTDFLSWRWILFVNVPVGIVAVVAAIRYLPESRADLEHRHLDLGGAITVTGGLVALVYALVRTESYSWGSSEVLIPLALGVVLLAVFVVLQARFSKAPLVPLRIFRSRSVSRRQRGDVHDVRGAVRLVVLRDAVHAARARLQPSPSGPRIPAADAVDRRGCTSDRSPGAEVRPSPAHPARDAGGRRGPGMARSGDDDDEFRRRAPRTVRDDRFGHGPGGNTDRRGRHRRGAAPRRGPGIGLAQHVTDRGRLDRTGRTRDDRRQPHRWGALREGGVAGAHGERPDRGTRWPSGSPQRYSWQLRSSRSATLPSLRAIKRASSVEQAEAHAATARAGLRRIGTGRSVRRGLELLHELEADAARGLDEGDTARAEGAAHRPRPPEHLVPGQFRVKIVDEQGGVQETLVRERRTRPRRSPG